MINDIYLDLAGRGYHIYTGPGLLSRLGDCLQKLPLSKKTLLVTNSKVGALYGSIAEKSLRAAGFEVITAVVPDSEEAKSLNEAGRLYDLAYDGGLDRQSPVVALGGGVVGDLAGFVAATYMRGTPFIQVPTTLLAQVDSSVGGKVAVNHPRGKNIIGAFYQPKLVLADINVLTTLEPREVKSGLAEVIKCGVIADAAFFSWLGNNLERILKLEPEPLTHAIAVSCRVKADIVEEDETEQGRRAILNFGHTVGHALEALAGYGRYRHGEAVAAGMVIEARLAAAMGYFSSHDANLLAELVRKAGLPAEMSAPALAGRLGEFLALLQKDKKAFAGQYTFALPVKIGRAKIFQDVPEKIIQEELKKYF